MRSLVRTRSGVFTTETGITLEEARALAAEGRLAEKMLPPDWPIQHLRRVDIPVRFAKQTAAGAKIPAAGIAEDAAEEDNLRVYLEGAFWGIMRRDGDDLVWKAQIAPEET
jgi:tRNA U55 pseudouridine synthase TruB